MTKAELNIPLESDEQQALFEWAKWQKGKYPELELMYHIPNEGKRSFSSGKRLVAEGLKKGVPDICLPAARCGYHGMYIEMKRSKGGKATKEQLWWQDRLTKQGYYAVICRGWEEAAAEILKYLKGAETR